MKVKIKNNTDNNLMPIKGLERDDNGEKRALGKYYLFSKNNFVPSFCRKKFVPNFNVFLCCSFPTFLLLHVELYFIVLSSLIFFKLPTAIMDTCIYCFLVFTIEIWYL